MYVHVPAAWLAFLSFGVVFVASVAYLRTGRIRWDRVAVASAEIGVLFCVLTLILGSLWGYPVWGTWWTWDPRLTTTVVLLLIYIGYLSLRSVANSPSQRAHWSAVVGVVGFIDVPIVHMSVVWWRSLHQEATVIRPGAPTMDTSMLVALLVGTVAFSVAYGYLMAVRLRVGRLEDRAAATSMWRPAPRAKAPSRRSPPARRPSGVETVADLGFIISGYGVTAAALLWYRWRLSRRGRRARVEAAALSGRSARTGGSRP